MSTGEAWGLVVIIFLFLLGLVFAHAGESGSDKAAGFCCLILSLFLSAALGSFLGQDSYQKDLTKVIPKAEVPIGGKKSFSVLYTVTYTDGKLGDESIQAVSGSVKALTWTPKVE